MIQNTAQAQAAGIPRLAMINSFAGFGRCSTVISLPVISAMQVQVCPVPTSILSNHLAFPNCHFHDYTSGMREHLHVWESLQLNFDGLYCGFLGSVEQITIVEEFLRSPIMQPVNDRPIFLLDPVMGDHGKTYSTVTPEHCSKLKELAAYAHILTPNITEACFLTDTPYKASPWTEDELILICQKLAALNKTGMPAKIVITGLQEQNSLINFVSAGGNYTSCRTEVSGAPRHGTGDLFASILAADALHQVPFLDSVRRASDFVALCIRGSEEAGLPLAEGILFEKYLKLL